MTKKCNICGRKLNTQEPESLDCGGDCAKCVADAGDQGAIDHIRAERLLREMLLYYSKLYVRNLPTSETSLIPWLAPVERKLTELLEYGEWYCSAWPGQKHIVTFFSDGHDGQGLRSLWQVNVTAGTVHKFI